MRVQRVKYGGFMSTAGQPVEFAFPPTGVVLVTGLNGSGKSTLVEAVSFGLWGKTLRGTDPKRTGSSGGVTVDTHVGMTVARHWGEGGKVQLEVGLEGEPSEEAWQFENNTKAQEHVVGVVGEWDTWRRSCAFSATDDLSFATATDAERKRLLEAILSLGKLDKALERCRADMKATTAALATAQRDQRDAQIRHAAAQQSLHQLEIVAAMMPAPADFPAMHAELSALEGLAFEADRVMQAANQAYRKATLDAATSEAKVSSLRASLHDLQAHATCPTCAQAWPDAEAREARISAFKSELDAAAASQVARPSDVALRQAQADAQEARTAVGAHAAKMRVAKAAADRHYKATLEVTSQRLEVSNQQAAILVADDQVARATGELEHLRQAEHVLGTKGARAHLLNDALVLLEQCANRWLNLVARVDAPLALKLTPYTEKKSGGSSDAIGLEVIGAGGGKGYKASSGGERRRIDCALMFALAEVAQMADNRVAPTMFLDEVFDALDDDGIEAVADALYHLSQDRCVVVISHSAKLENHLSAVCRLRATGGLLEVER